MKIESDIPNWIKNLDDEMRRQLALKDKVREMKK